MTTMLTHVLGVGAVHMEAGVSSDDLCGASRQPQEVTNKLNVDLIEAHFQMSVEPPKT